MPEDLRQGLLALESRAARYARAADQADADPRTDPLLDQWRELLLEHPYPHINQWLDHIGAENKQGNINKEECVNIIKKLSLKTFEGSHKVLIMWLPEYLGKEGNRLLKLIEEPPTE